MVATSEVKKMDNKLIIDNADITADTGIVCLYDTEHVKTETTLDVVGKCCVQRLYFKAFSRKSLVCCRLIMVCGQLHFHCVVRGGNETS